MGGRGLGGVCVHINRFGYHIKKYGYRIKAWGTTMLKAPRENTVLISELLIVMVKSIYLLLFETCMLW